MAALIWAMAKTKHPPPARSFTCPPPPHAPPGSLAEQRLLEFPRRHPPTPQAHSSLSSQEAPCVIGPGRLAAEDGACPLSVLTASVGPALARAAPGFPGDLCSALRKPPQAPALGQCGSEDHGTCLSRSGLRGYLSLPHSSTHPPSAHLLLHLLQLSSSYPFSQPYSQPCIRS